MEFLTFFDGIVLVVVLISAILAMYRGFLREVLSIAAWVAAAVAAYLLYPKLLPLAKEYVTSDYVALGATVAGIFVVTLLVVSYLTMKLSDFVLDSAFGPLDRSAGFLFGAARGVLLFAVVMLFVNWFVEDKKQPPWIANAKSKPVLSFIGERIVAALPDDPERVLIDQIRQKARELPQQGDEAETADDRPPSAPAAAPRAAPPAPARPASPGGQRTETRPPAAAPAVADRGSLDQIIRRTESQR